jgi:AcrR family transcriptional regulator
VPEPSGSPPLGLRERKKAQTHTAIQAHALRLFREQGYEATTVEQIAEAAEVSPSTFFRYFATKEEVVLHDSLDPLMLAAFEAQPAQLSPVQAMRAATRAVFAGLSAEQLAEEREREALIRAIPELRAQMLDSFAGSVGWFAEVVARRAGRDVQDVAVLALVGAVFGVGITLWLTGGDATTGDFLERFDAAMAQLEAGLTL